MKRLINFFTYPLVRYGIISLLIYWLLYSIYAPITLGLDMEDVTILTVPTVVGLFLFQYFLGATILHRPFLGHGIVAIAWALTFPILFHWSYTKVFYFYEFANDFLFGLFLFMGLVLWQYACTLPFKRTNWVAAFFALFDWGLSLIPFAQIAYYLVTWHCLTPNSLMAIYQTSPEESLAFVKNVGGIFGTIGLAILLIAVYAFFFWCNKGMPYLVNRSTTKPIRHVILGIACIALLVYVPFILYPRTCIVSAWTQIADYTKQLQSYDQHHIDVYKDIHLNTKETAAQKVPGTIIVVIGESSSRNYMKVYTPSFPYDDTPWQDKESHNKDFIFFNHAYSSYVQTVPTLERALSERNQYDDKPFLESANILDIAKKAGYHTYWLSNQGVYGQYDTAISLMAKTAQTAKWAHESYEFSDKYDEALLPLLKNTVKPGQSNFVVIHIMGSHIYYNDRYPHAFSKWKKGDVPTGMEAYANSQLYTDWLLQQIFTYAKDHLNLQAMVYFSDHGESITLSHNPDIFNFDMTRIPFWMYLSPEYRAAYPQTAATLDAHQHQYFTNDLLYDTISGLIQAPSNRYEAGRDFTNPSYRFNKNNLTTMLGTKHLTEDPDINL